MGSRSRTRGKQIDERDTLFSEREPYGAMFHCVYLSAAYLQSTTKAKALLFDLIYQHRGKNNGTLVLCPNEKDNKDGLTVHERTGLSEASIYRAAAELEARGLITCTRRGNFSRKVSYYALTWAPIDRTHIRYESNVSEITPLHWWKKGPPEWHLKKLRLVSGCHQKMIETIRGSQTDNQDPLTVVTMTAANVQ